MEKFNRDKVLKNLEHKKNKNTYIKYGTFVFAICIGVFSITYIAYSKFVTTSTINVSELVVGEFTQPTLKMAAYLDGEYIKGSSLTDGFPTSNDTYSVESVSCTNGVNGTFDTTTWALTVDNTEIKTKCNIYFVTKTTNSDNGTDEQVASDDATQEETTADTNTTESTTSEETSSNTTTSEDNTVIDNDATTQTTEEADSNTTE